MLAINLSLAFCMDTNTEEILNSPIGQPMAAILFSRFGQKGTLAIWSFVVIAQYVTLSLPSVDVELIRCQIYDGVQLGRNNILASALDIDSRIGCRSIPASFCIFSRPCTPFLEHSLSSKQAYSHSCRCCLVCRRACGIARSTVVRRPASDQCGLLGNRECSLYRLHHPYCFALAGWQ